MKYIVERGPRKDGASGIDYYQDEYNTAEEAVKAAKLNWSYLTNRERKALKIVVIESVNPDEGAENHFDGNIIFTAGEEAAEE